MALPHSFSDYKCKYNLDSAKYNFNRLHHNQQCITAHPFYDHRQEAAVNGLSGLLKPYMKHIST